MDVSFELLSSMSPKINRYQKPTKKTPTILALKKHIRKSIDSNYNNQLKDTSVVLIESASNTTSSSFISANSRTTNTTPIVISDSEKSNDHNSTPRKTQKPAIDNENKKVTRLSKEKFTDICQWVDEVNTAKENCSILSEVSTILGDYNPRFKKPGTNIAASSTLLHSEANRFDELFNRAQSKESANGDTSLTASKLKNSADDVLVNDSLEDNVENLNLDDSLNIIKTDDLYSRIKKKSDIEKTPDYNSISDFSEYENLLDSLYDNSWRARKEEILPSSEPRKSKSMKKKVLPNTERHSNKISSTQNHEKEDNNLLKILQKTRFKKALQSPLTQTLKNICDSDESVKLMPVKLNFENNSDEIDKTSHKVSPKKQVKNNHKNNKTINDNAKTCSFLASLSANVSIDKCDFTALIFRENFKENKQTLCIKLFKLYNEKVFENAIPDDTPIEWSDRMVRTAGTCTCKKITRRNGEIQRTAKITLSNKVIDSADRLRDTLIHELCHAATWIVNKISDGHGSFWKAWAHCAMKTFPELPPINRCHAYVINTKYTYKCTGCGYSIGRHTKSLDVQRKRCGYCFGTFEVLLNKVSKKGETKSVPATPKKANGFALFVKENYATFKTPDLKHGDVMKILGQKFANLKVDKS